jgi:RHO1 GDP-GTP exchange protein 1/2
MLTDCSSKMYIEPLRNEEPPIISPERVEDFISEVFHNYAELAEHHRRLMDRFFEIQLEQHPVIRSLTAALMDAALNFRDAYMEYIPNYPRAAYRIDEEMATNPAFKAFVDVRHPIIISNIYLFWLIRFFLIAMCEAQGRASIGYEKLY